RRPDEQAFLEGQDRVDALRRGGDERSVTLPRLGKSSADLAQQARSVELPAGPSLPPRRPVAAPGPVGRTLSQARADRDARQVLGHPQQVGLLLNQASAEPPCEDPAASPAAPAQVLAIEAV